MELINPKSYPYLLTKMCQFLLLLLLPLQHPKMQFPQAGRRLLRSSIPSLLQLTGRAGERTRKPRETRWNLKPKVKDSNQSCYSRLLVFLYNGCSALRENISFAPLTLIANPHKSWMVARDMSLPETACVNHQASLTLVRTLLGKRKRNILHRKLRQGHQWERSWWRIQGSTQPVWEACMAWDQFTPVS